jgi:hypothetical protein
MTRREANTAILAGAAVLVAGPASATQETEAIALPPPRSMGGKPLIEALMLRRSTREYSERPLPLQVLSDLLWAAFGVNRPSGEPNEPSSKCRITGKVEDDPTNAQPCTQESALPRY